MKTKYKSYFGYSKSQRNGIYTLFFLIILVQLFICFYDFKEDEIENVEVSSIQSQLDSLKKQQSTFYLKPFNPNYISDYKAYQLGLSTQEIDRLLSFRSQNKYVNSKEEFQKVTQVSDSLLSKITPYFKFPSWVSNKPKVRSQAVVQKRELKDINTATKDQLIRLKGIGEKRATSILKYRKLLGGYSYNKQLDEVWGLPPEVLEVLKREFQVLSIPKIKKLNVNNATFSELKRIVYIDYKQAKRILEYREEVAEIQNLAELKTITDFPVDKFDLISIYLQAE